jgi:hypothetical protein
VRKLGFYAENQLANMLANYAKVYDCFMQPSMKEFVGTYEAAARVSQLMVEIVEHINRKNIEPEPPSLKKPVVLENKEQAGDLPF